MENVNKEIAKTIIEQLGGAQFVMLTGAKRFVAAERAVLFSIGSNPKHVSRVRVVLEANDTYTLYFYNSKLDVVALERDVYCDKLQDIFEQETELYVTLHARRS